MTRALLLVDGAARVVDVELPDVGPRGVRVAVDLTTVCGRDRAALAASDAAAGPLLLGHEAVGTVREVGGEVEGLETGDRVAVTARRRCGTCGTCRRGGPCTAAPGVDDPTFDGAPVRRLDGVGGLAEEVVVEVDRLQPLPDGMPPAHAVAAACAGPVGMAAVRTLASVWPGEVVLVVGAGGVGTLAVQTAVAAGARTVVAVDPDPARREAVAGDDVTAVAPDDVAGVLAGVTDAGGADHVVVCAPGPARLAEALAWSRPGGTVVLVGGDGPGDAGRVTPGDLVAAGRRLLGGHWGGAVPSEDVPRLLELAVDRRVDLDAVTEEVPGDGLAIAAELLVAGSRPPRPVLRP